VPTIPKITSRIRIIQTILKITFGLNFIDSLMITNLRKSKKKFWRTISFSIIPILLAIGVIGLLVFTNWKIKQRRAELQERIEVLKREIQTLEEKTAALRAGITQTETEDYQIEQLYEQGYFEEGATPVVVLPPEEEKGGEVSEEKSLWHPQTWWEWLKSKVRD
jgi:cell division protein FtsB